MGGCGISRFDLRSPVFSSQEQAHIASREGGRTSAHTTVLGLSSPVLRPPIPRWCPSRWSDCVSPSHQSINHVCVCVWSHPVGGTEASWGRSSVRSTLVRPLRNQWLSPLCILLILTLRTRPPRQGYATVTSVCCLRLNQVSNLPMRDLCVGCSVRGPGVVRRVGGLCPGGVRCGVPR